MFAETRPCRECGKPYVSRQQSGFFCSNPCRQAFHRRRAERGAELYDVIMAAQYAKDPVAKDVVNMLLAAYKKADDTLREGRQSWQEWKHAQTRIPMTYGSQGDRR